MNSGWDLERDAFLSMTPPRHVPAAIRKRAASFRSILAILLFGLAFGGIGLIFVAIFSPTHLPKQWKLDRGPATIVPGIVENSSETNLSINDVQVVRYQFSYRPEGGEQLRGEAFTTGTRWTTGETVDVRYLAADPTLAAPVGARLGQGHAMMLFVLIFPLVGFSLAIGSIWGLRSKRRLLRHGWVTMAKVDALKPTRTKVNDRPQYKIHLTLSDSGKSVAKRVHSPTIIEFLEQRRRSGTPVAVLYDANKPHRLMFPESWK